MNKIIKNEITRSKIVDLETAIKNVGLKDGDVISFHHHFRNGDKTMQLVIDAISKLKIKNLTIASSSLTGAHNFLIDYIKDGTVTGLETSGCRGKLGEFISHGNLKNPMIIRSHGGRARAIKNGDLKIDVAFLGVSSADEMGNANGVIGKSICGALGYAIVDSKYAKNTIVLTDHIVSYPNPIVSISQIDVDYVVKVKEIGDSSKIMSGEIRLTSNPKEEVIAKNIAQVVTNLSWFKDGFSMQMGTGGASLSAIKEIKTKMIEKGYKAGFCLGGITSHQVKLLEENLTNLLIDVQSFDLGAAESLLKNEKHIEIDADMYANPFNKSPYCNKLDFVILSALEVDVNFNVNVITGSDGVIRGASGGHSDTAMGAKVSIVALPLFRGRIPCITNKVITNITPGESVDVIVTDFGIAVNPNRQDLIKTLKAKKIPLVNIQHLADQAQNLLGKGQEIKFNKDKVVAIVEHREGKEKEKIYQCL